MKRRAAWDVRAWSRGSGGPRVWELRENPERLRRGVHRPCRSLETIERMSELATCFDEAEICLGDPLDHWADLLIVCNEDAERGYLRRLRDGRAVDVARGVDDVDLRGLLTTPCQARSMAPRTEASSAGSNWTTVHP